LPYWGKGELGTISCLTSEKNSKNAFRISLLVVGLPGFIIAYFSKQMILQQIEWLR
jgi:hypothetical protein